MVSAAITGAFLGLGVQLYVNAIRKLPMFRNPWQHAIAAGAGAGFTTWLVEYEARTEKEVAGTWDACWFLQCKFLFDEGNA